MVTRRQARKNRPNYHTVWATLESVAKRQEETDRQMKETDRIIKENAERQKETDRIVKENAKQMGRLDKRFGETVEYMVAPNLLKKFRELGLNFSKANSNSDISDYDNGIFMEIDVMLENGDKAMVVEIKTKPNINDVKDHIKRLENMREYADLHGDKRAFLGAVAGVVIKPNVKDYALSQGFYFIEPSEETFNITVPNGQPKEW